MAIVVVSGLPRSGTSMMMQMLAAGGMPVLTDGIRAADEDNPRGYFEYEPVKQLPKDATWLAEAEGRAVKVIHTFLERLPDGHEYRVVFMKRALPAVLASQRVMIRRRGTAGSAVADDALAGVFQRQVTRIEAWLAARPHIAVLPVVYETAVDEPQATAERIASFVGHPLDVAAMAATVDPALRRQRG